MLALSEQIASAAADAPVDALGSSNESALNKLGGLSR
jgi:hypothetical protein